MLCDECKQKPATVHLAQFYNGKKVKHIFVITARLKKEL